MTKVMAIDMDEQWSCSISVGGSYMSQLIVHTAKVLIDIVPAVATVQADPMNNIAAVEGVPEIPTDTWVQDIQEMCQALIESTNQTIARWYEFKEMPRGDRTFEKW